MHFLKSCLSVVIIVTVHVSAYMLMFVISQLCKLYIPLLGDSRTIYYNLFITISRWIHFEDAIQQVVMSALE